MSGTQRESQGSREPTHAKGMQQQKKFLSSFDTEDINISKAEKWLRAGAQSAPQSTDHNHFYALLIVKQLQESSFFYIMR